MKCECCGGSGLCKNCKGMGEQKDTLTTLIWDAINGIDPRSDAKNHLDKALKLIQEKTKMCRYFKHCGCFDER